MSRLEMIRCEFCGRGRAPRFAVAIGGALVDQTPPCECPDARRARKACAECGATPAPFKRGDRVRRCARCRAARKRPWSRLVNVDRRLAGICQRCDAPVVGRLKVALYCAEHRKEARSEAQAKKRAEKGAEYTRRFRERHRKRLNRKARAYARKHRQQRAEYKREWRKKNRDRVRAQKRRAALRRGGSTPSAIVRWRERVAAGEHEPNRAPRNERGERLCLRCPTPLTGRAKLCTACRSPESAVREAA